MAESIRETTVQYPSGKVVIMRAFVAAPQRRKNVRPLLWSRNGWGSPTISRILRDGMQWKGMWRSLRTSIPVLDIPSTTDAGEAGKLMNTLKQEDGLNDLKATVAYLKSVPEVDATRIGVTGFCMGGSYALMLPCVNPENQSGGAILWPGAQSRHTAPETGLPGVVFLWRGRWLDYQGGCPASSGGAEKV